MLVKVFLRREGGAHRPMHGPSRAMARGDLQIGQHTESGRSVPILRLAGVDREWPVLFEPRMIAMWNNEMTFVGYERHGKAWVLQQWDCELLAG